MVRPCSSPATELGARLHAQAGTKERPPGTYKGTEQNEESSMT